MSELNILSVVSTWRSIIQICGLSTHKLKDCPRILFGFPHFYANSGVTSVLWSSPRPLLHPSSLFHSSVLVLVLLGRCSPYNLKPSKTKLRGFSPQANYTDRATAACCEVSANFLWIEGVAWSAQRIPTAVILCFLDWSRYLVAPQLYLRGWAPFQTHYP
jgi:hypothetical protein